MVLLDDNTGYPDETHETLRISKSRRLSKKRCGNASLALFKPFPYHRNQPWNGGLKPWKVTSESSIQLYLRWYMTNRSFLEQLLNPLKQTAKRRAPSFLRIVTAASTKSTPVPRRFCGDGERREDGGSLVHPSASWVVFQWAKSRDWWVIHGDTIWKP